ncbi:CD209 antigen [Octodon degus]|uniref:CD209 antigen n=1 Tax=Octodon degus TaxID=10160 RepID=A0A6P3VDR6_OCTDE|nr:CD209 antigen [Octodon degus]
MTDTKEARAPQLGPLDEEELIAVGPRSFLKGFGYQRSSGYSHCAGCLGNDSSRLVLQLLAIMLFSALLVAILVQVSRSPSFQELEQEQSNQEEINQKLHQLKARVDNLCRPCPWEWTFFQGKCYFFSKSQRNWHDSGTACEEEGARLVIVESADEQSFLQLTSKSKGHTWMGLSDLNKESTWHWVDGSPLLLSFMKYWNPSEPNNLGEEDCAEFDGDGWNDARCDISKYFICKQAAASCSN